MADSDLRRRVFEALTAEDDGRACADISESACREQPDSFLRHVVALSLSKSGDALADPKLVLSYLMTAVGAPAAMVAFLVPIREAGALLPQLVTAARIRAMPRRKWAWAAAAAVQGAALLLIALAAAGAEGAAAGAMILAALAVLALARSVTSVSYKDVLGKTVASGRRGSATGLATSLSAATAIGFAGLLILGWIDRQTLVLGAVVLGGLAFLGAAVVFGGLREERGATEGGANGLSAALGTLRHLRADPQLRLFIAVRGLLTATALAPPYFVVLAGGADSALSGLGALVLASALAALLSGAVWGRLSDRSSRAVLILTGVSGAGAMVLALALVVAGLDSLLPLALFALMVAYQGVRIARSTYLVDMAPQDLRAGYTALANTAIGVILLFGGVIGAVASALGAEATLVVFAVLSLGAAVLALGLRELGEDKE